MKRWMVYVLVVAAVAAVILIITLPGVLNKEPQIELPVQVVNQGEKLSVNLKQFVSDEKVDEVALELIDGPGDLSGFSYTFEPGFSYAGEIAVRIRATDEQGKSSEDEMLVNVIRVNRPPEIDTSPVVVNEGETLSIDLNSIAVDPDGDNLEFSVEGPGELEGSIYTYSPGYNDAGDGVLRVTARDTHGNETARDIPLEIIDVNAPPVMQIKNQVVNEGERISVDIASAAVDVDGDEIFFSIEQGPGLLEDGLFVYEPSFADAGTKSVIIRVVDSYGNEAFSSFEVEVKDFNRPPKLLLSDIVLNEGDTVQIDFLERVIDPDGDEVSFAIEGPGEIVDGKYKYTPRFGEAGEESVTVFLEDEKGGTSTTAFRIRVNEVNRPPTVSIPDWGVKEGETLRIYLRAFVFDPDGDDLDFEIVEGPGAIEDGHYLYSPDFDSEGTHEVKLLARDSKGLESIGTFTVDVENVNRAPVKVIPSLNTTIMETFTLNLDLSSLFFDPDGDDLEFEMEGYGRIEESSYVFSPDYNDQGQKLATVTAYDSLGLSDSLLIRIDVRDKNRDPESAIKEINTSIREGFSLRIDLNPLFSDPDGDELTFTVSGPGMIDDGYYSYSPNHSEAGQKSVIITASDGKGGSLSLPINIAVIDVNRPPTVSIPDWGVKEGETLRIYLRAFVFDPDGDDLDFEIVEGPGAIEDGHYLYSPDFDSEGTHEVKLLARDSKGLESIGTFTVDVENVNRAPVKVIPSLNTTIMETFTLNLDLSSLFFDPDGDDLEFEMEGYGRIEESSYVFSPDYNDQGQKLATVTAYDSLGLSDSLLIRIDVRDKNRDPESAIKEINTSIREGFSLRIDLNPLFSDPDGDELTFTVSGPGMIDDGYYSYSPNHSEAGQKSVIITASDGKGGSLSLPINIAVIDVNRPPTVSIPDWGVKEGETLRIYLRAFVFDPDGDDLDFEIVEGPGAIEDGHYLYSPDFDSEGTHEVKLLARDSKGLESIGTFTVDVENVNRAPVKVIPSLNTTIMETFTLNLDLSSLFFDPDGDDLEFEMEGYGRIEESSYVFSPDYNDQGQKLATVTAYDSLGLSDSLLIRIDVRDKNRDPESAIKEINTSIREGFSLRIDLNPLFSDPDGDELTFTVSGPGMIDDGYYSYSPNHSEAGQKSVIITASDGKGGSLSLPINIAVIDVNRPPTVSIPDWGVKEGETLRIYLRAFVFDPDGDDLDFEIVEGPGAIEDGHYLYSPDFDSEGTHEVKLLARDSKGLESIGTFTVDVENVNRAPVKVIPSLNTTIMETFTLNLDLSSLFFDPDGDDLEFEMEGYGRIEESSYVFSPDYNDQGQKLATVTAYDSLGLSDSLLIRIDVRDKNRDPESAIKEINTSIREGFSLRIDLNPLFSDPDGDELTFTVSGPGMIDDGYYSYSPNHSEAGQKSVIITASDGKGGSLSLPINIAVIDVNRPPTVSIPDWGVKEGETLRIYLRAFVFDPDGDDLDFEIVEGPGAIEDGHYLYSPDFDSEGTHEVKLLARDSKELESIGTFTVDVENVNRVPVKVIPSLNTTIMETFTLNLDLSSLFFDPDGDDLEFEMEGYGRIEESSYVFSPDYNDQGQKLATVTAYDSLGLSDSLLIRIDVRDKNRDPESAIKEINTSIREGFSLRIDLNPLFSDPDGDELTFTVSGPGMIDDGYYSYSPNHSEAGQKSVIITASDGKGGSLSLPINIAVIDVNRPPTVSIPDWGVKEGETLRIYLRAFVFDPDGDDLDFEIVEGPGAIEDGHYLYSPDFDSEGTHEVKLLARDSKGLESIGTFTVDVENVNRAPVKVIPSLNTTIMETFTLNLDLSSLFFDPDGDDLEFEMEGYGRIEESSYVFSPDYNDQGQKLATVTAYDSLGLSDSLLIRIDVRDKNRDPESAIKEINTSIREGFSLRIDLNPLFSDPDGDELTFTVSGPGMIDDGYYSYSPNHSEAGQKSVIITASDGKGGSLSLPINIAVIDVNRPPTVSIPDWGVKEGETLRIYLRAFVFDPDGDDLDFEIVEGPGAIEDGHYLYSPDFDSEGTHEVKLLARDSKGLESIGTFTVDVENVNRAPVKVIPSLNTTIMETFTLNLDLSSFFFDPDGDDLEFEMEGYGRIEESSYVFSPDYNDQGQKLATVTAYDSLGLSDSLLIRIDVRDKNRPADLFIPDGIAEVGSEYSLYLREFASDPDGDNLEFRLLSGPGEVVEGRYSFIPTRKDIGKNEVLLEVMDEKGMKTENRFTVMVETSEKVTIISYALRSVDSDLLRIVAGQHEILSQERQSVVKTDWIFNFNEIHFFAVNESGDTLIGTAVFDDVDSQLNRKIYSPAGDYMGNIILVTE